jgi:hypothetical protein
MVIMDKEGICWHCGQRLTGPDYAREAACPACGRPTHVCRNCRFYAPGRSNDCLEPVAEHVADKQRANFCDYFEPGQDTHREGPDNEHLRAVADDLFDL